MTAPISVVNSFHARCVAVHVAMRASGYGNSIKVQANVDLSTADTRELAANLIDAADKADVKAATKAAAEDRRKAWQDREVRAGLMKVLSW